MPVPPSSPSVGSSRYPSYTSYTSSYRSPSSSSSYGGRTTSLDRSSYLGSYGGSSYSSNYTSTYTSKYSRPPIPSYSSATDSYRSSRSLRQSPVRSSYSRLGSDSQLEPSSSISTSTSRYSSSRYSSNRDSSKRDASSSRDSGYGSRLSSRDRSVDVINGNGIDTSHFGPSASSYACNYRWESKEKEKSEKEDTNDNAENEKIRVTDRIRVFEPRSSIGGGLLAGRESNSSLYSSTRDLSGGTSSSLSGRDRGYSPIKDSSSNIIPRRRIPLTLVDIPSTRSTASPDTRGDDDDRNNNTSNERRPSVTELRLKYDTNHNFTNGISKQDDDDDDDDDESDGSGSSTGHAATADEDAAIAAVETITISLKGRPRTGSITVNDRKDLPLVSRVSSSGQASNLAESSSRSSRFDSTSLGLKDSTRSRSRSRYDPEPTTRSSSRTRYELDSSSKGVRDTTRSSSRTRYEPETQTASITIKDSTRSRSRNRYEPDSTSIGLKDTTRSSSRTRYEPDSTSLGSTRSRSRTRYEPDSTSIGLKDTTRSSSRTRYESPSTTLRNRLESSTSRPQSPADRDVGKTSLYVNGTTDKPKARTKVESVADTSTLSRTRNRQDRAWERIAARLANEDEDSPPRRHQSTISNSTSSIQSSSGTLSENNGLVGLRNIGNTCFMNSVMQCLSNTRCLLEYLIKDGYSSDVNSTISTMKGDLVQAFAELLSDMWNEGGDNSRALNTGPFKSQIQRFAPVFSGYQQHDAQEFLRKLLEGLHEDVNRVVAKPKPILEDIDDDLDDSQKAMESWKRYLRYDDSKIVDMFVGQLKSCLQCSVCGHCSVTFDPFWDLSLPIPSKSGQVRLSQCLDLFTKEEVLDGDERPTCSKCKERRKMTKSFSIQKFPKVLVLHLKRFSPLERWRGKLSCTVEFPLESLDLSKYASNSSCPPSFNLIGVANHSGTTYSGHYTAYCKHPYSGTWHEYNDSRVSNISQGRICSPEAYVLFYEMASGFSKL